MNTFINTGEQKMHILDQDTEDFIYDLVINYMQGAKMFTSLDITNQAKDAGHRVRNHQVADWLRRNVIVLAQANSFLYNQSLITVDSKAAGTTLAYLYHHYQDDTDDYLDRDQNPKSFQTAAPATNNGLVGGFAWPVQKSAIPTPSSDERYFATREAARNFARTSSVWKFHDNGNYALPGERWSCVM